MGSGTLKSTLTSFLRRIGASGRAAERIGELGDVHSRGLFPVCPATHDHGLRRLFDLSTLLLLLDCKPGDRVLDLGAGSGFSSEMLARLGYTVVAVDPDLAALHHNRHRPSYDASRLAGSVRVCGGIAESLPFTSTTFDGVIAMNVLHHVGDLPRATGELLRVLKPGGRAVICEPGLNHLASEETQRARIEHGEDDRPFDVLMFLKCALDVGFADAMLSATLQSPLRLLPLAEVELFRRGHHPRPHMTPAGVLEELHRNHAFAMLVAQGNKPRTSRNPSVLVADLRIADVPPSAAPGAALVLQVEMTNTGDTLWLSTPSAFGWYVTIGVKVLKENGRLVTDLLGRTHLSADIPPGGHGNATMRLTLPAALEPGRYLLRFDMVNELAFWFSDLQPTSARDYPIVVTL